MFDFQLDKTDGGEKKEHELMYESEDLDFFNEQLVDDVVMTLAKKNGEIENEVQPPKLERRMSHSSVSYYDVGSSKELLPSVVQEHLKKPQTERKSGSESSEAPTGKNIFLNNI